MNHFGIIVFGNRRARALENTLLSIEKQGALSCTHVWLDGYAHSPDIAPKVKACQELSGRFPTAAWHVHNGRLGIEKLMLDGLTFMAGRYRFIIVLEDDCFPTHDAVKTFLQALTEVEEDRSVYSVYGHHFDVPGEGERFTRFQGWGWATTRDKLVPVLAQLKSMFDMTEEDYLRWTNSVLKPDIVQRLDVTPGRDVVKVLKRQFSWDSATALLTAILGLSHCKTPRRVVYNCGLGPDSGHFMNDTEFLRKPPFNMIGEDEVWQYYYEPLSKQYANRKCFGLDDLDLKLAEYITGDDGFFIELGAHDGLNQTNTLFFERRGWRGLLIEANPESYEKCVRNRPLSRVVHAACVAPDFQGDTVELTAVGLMSLVAGARGGGSDEEEWVSRGERLQGLVRKSCRVPTRTLTDICAATGVSTIDLLSLDVEGYELNVLRGLDFARFRPRFIAIEDSAVGEVQSYLEANGYIVVAVLNQRQFTKDILCRDGAIVLPDN